MCFGSVVTVPRRVQRRLPIEGGCCGIVYIQLARCIGTSVFTIGTARLRLKKWGRSKLTWHLFHDLSLQILERCGAQGGHGDRRTAGWLRCGYTSGLGPPGRSWFMSKLEQVSSMAGLSCSGTGTPSSRRRSHLLSVKACAGVFDGEFHAVVLGRRPRTKVTSAFQKSIARVV